MLDTFAAKAPVLWLTLSPAGRSILDFAHRSKAWWSGSQAAGIDRVPDGRRRSPPRPFLYRSASP